MYFYKQIIWTRNPFIMSHEQAIPPDSRALAQIAWICIDPIVIEVCFKCMPSCHRGCLLWDSCIIWFPRPMEAENNPKWESDTTKSRMSWYLYVFLDWTRWFRQKQFLTSKTRCSLGMHSWLKYVFQKKHVKDTQAFFPNKNKTTHRQFPAEKMPCSKVEKSTPLSKPHHFWFRIYF